MAVKYGKPMGDKSVVDVAIQDQASATIILPLVRAVGTTTLASTAVRNTYTFTVTSTAGMLAGQHVRIINALADRYYAGTILSIAGSVITVDNAIDYAYLAGSEVTISYINMNVNGATTPVAYKLRTGVPSIPSAIDVTRIIMVCESSSAVDLNKFGSITKLTRGILFRKTLGDNAVIYNVFNAKSNRDLAGIGYDWTPYEATHPTQGINGFSWRLTFNGQEKLGVVLRVEQFGNLEMLVQDDLTGLTSLAVTVEGHVVQP